MEPRKSRPVRSLLRILVPSWRFFNQVGPIPSLLYRVSPQPESVEGAPWQTLFLPVPRNLFSIFLNEKGNLQMAYKSFMQPLLHELNDHEERVNQTVSYHLVKELVHQVIVEREKVHTTSWSFQFKLCVDSEDILISPIYRGSIEHDSLTD